MDGQLYLGPIAVGPMIAAQWQGPPIQIERAPMPVQAPATTMTMRISKRPSGPTSASWPVGAPVRAVGRTGPHENPSRPVRDHPEASAKCRDAAAGIRHALRRSGVRAAARLPDWSYAGQAGGTSSEASAVRYGGGSRSPGQAAIASFRAARSADPSGPRRRRAFMWTRALLTLSTATKPAASNRATSPSETTSSVASRPA